MCMLVDSNSNFAYSPTQIWSYLTSMLANWVAILEIYVLVNSDLQFLYFSVQFWTLRTAELWLGCLWSHWKILKRTYSLISTYILGIDVFANFDLDWDLCACEITFLKICVLVNLGLTFWKSMWVWIEFKIFRTCILADSNLEFMNCSVFLIWCYWILCAYWFCLLRSTSAFSAILMYDLLSIWRVHVKNNPS